jgi:hypothetical protein
MDQSGQVSVGSRRTFSSDARSQPVFSRPHGIATKRVLMSRTTACALIIAISLSITDTIQASQCDQALVAASQLGFAHTSQNRTNLAAQEGSCHAYLKQFIDAVTARQIAATCQDGVGRVRALETLDSEIEMFNDLIAVKSCGQ